MVALNKRHEPKGLFKPTFGWSPTRHRPFLLRAIRCRRRSGDQGEECRPLKMIRHPLGHVSAEVTIGKRPVAGHGCMTLPGFTRNTGFAHRPGRLCNPKCMLLTGHPYFGVAWRPGLFPCQPITANLVLQLLCISFLYPGRKWQNSHTNTLQGRMPNPARSAPPPQALYTWPCLCDSLLCCQPKARACQ